MRLVDPRAIDLSSEARHGSRLLEAKETMYESLNEAQVFGLLDRWASKLDLRFESLLDVGSSDRPAIDWFRRYSRSEKPRDFLAVELDDAKGSILRDRGLDVVSEISMVDRRFDLALALEVIEHVPATETIDFLRRCASKTEKLFVLTTPNFEYWQRFRPTAEYKECRWIPGQALDFKPGSENPHAHQQEMTPNNLLHYMVEAFPPDDWQVGRAWP